MTVPLPFGATVCCNNQYLVSDGNTGLSGLPDASAIGAFYVSHSAGVISFITYESQTDVTFTVSIGSSQTSFTETAGAGGFPVSPPLSVAAGSSISVQITDPSSVSVQIELLFTMIPPVGPGP